MIYTPNLLPLPRSLASHPTTIFVDMYSGFCMFEPLCHLILGWQIHNLR